MLHQALACGRAIELAARVYVNLRKGAGFKEVLEKMKGWFKGNF